MSAVARVTLPDGKTLEVEVGSTCGDAARKIGPGLARAALAAYLDGDLCSLDERILGDATLRVVTRKSPGRIPRNTQASTSRLKLIRTIIDAGDQKTLVKAVDELMDSFGLPDDWEVLVRVLEHSNEDFVFQSVEKMRNLLAVTAKVPRKATLKERLRTIGQTAGRGDLREMAAELEEKL